MENLGQSVNKVYLIILFFLYTGSVIAQEKSQKKAVNDEALNRTIKRNITSIFSVNPLGNIDNIKYEGFYAILKIKKEKVSEIIYPDFIDEKITRRKLDAIINLNKDIESGELVLSGINQIIVPAIREWIHYKTNNPNLDEALKNIIPKTGYTSKTYLMSPIIIYTGNPRR